MRPGGGRRALCGVALARRWGWIGMGEPCGVLLVADARAASGGDRPRWRHSGHAALSRKGLGPRSASPSGSTWACWCSWGRRCLLGAVMSPLIPRRLRRFRVARPPSAWPGERDVGGA